MDEASEHFQRALSVKESYAEAHHNLGTVLKEQHKINEAITHYRRALTLKPDYPEAHTSLGIILVEQGRLEDASAAAERADQLGDKMSSPSSHYALGALLARCGLKEVARKHLQFYLERDLKDRRGGRMLLASLGFEPTPDERQMLSCMRFILSARILGINVWPTAYVHIAGPS